MGLRVEQPDDAIVYKYVSPHVLVSLVIPVSMIRIYEADGWQVLIRQDALRWCDWFETMKEEIQKWRRG